MVKSETPKFKTANEYQDEILKVLNANEKAVKCLKSFNDTGKRLIEKGEATEEDYQGARKTLLLMLIGGNKEAMSLYSEMMYYSLRGELQD